jgi:hypothetical protein
MDPKDKVTALRLYFQRKEDPVKSSTLPAMSAMNNAILDFQKGNLTKDEARDRIANQKGLSDDQKVKSLSMVESIENGLVGGPAEAATLKLLESTILKGVPVDKLQEVFSNTSGEYRALNERWKWAFFEASAEQGADFNPRKWLIENKDEIQKEVQLIANDDPYDAPTQAEVRQKIEDAHNENRISDAEYKAEFVKRGWTK